MISQPLEKLEEQHSRWSEQLRSRGGRTWESLENQERARVAGLRVGDKLSPSSLGLTL